MMDDEKIPALNSPNTPYNIRPVLASDLFALQSDIWREIEPAVTRNMVSRIQQIAIQGRGLGIIVLDDARVIAYGQVAMWTRCAEISDLLVSEDYRSQGIGTAMIQYLAQVARDIYAPCLEIGVVERNERALALYEKLGFERTRTLMLNMGDGVEPVIYLRISLRRT